MRDPVTQPSVAGPLRVIAVDDDQTLLSQIAEGMNEQRYRVRTFTDGQHALIHAQRHDTDVVVVDLVMPGMDGTDLMAALADDARTCHIPVVVLTGLLSTLDAAERFDRAARRIYLAKPTSIRVLSKVIDAITRLSA
jgi:DNA-binding response OmpR family regulator